MKRVVNCIRNSILKHRDNVLRRQSVEAVAEKMHSIAASTIDAIEKSVDSSPMRVISFDSLTYLILLWKVDNLKLMCMQNIL